MVSYQARSASLLTKVPAADRETIDRWLQEELAQHQEKIIVLDDDPTGVQTVHDISVYTNGEEASIEEGFREVGRVFFLLTNSRSLTAEESYSLHDAIGQRVIEVSKRLERPFLLISRSDSTLRGHYPLETETLRKALAKQGYSVDGEVLCYYFEEGGRYTIDNVHYVKQGDQLIPAGETEFARDATFGYRSSNLCDYVEEKTEGRYRSKDVVTISIEELRRLDLDAITNKLLSVTDFGKIVVNAMDSYDIKIFCICLYRALAKGKRFLFRSAAALVKEVGGITDRPYLSRSEMLPEKNEKRSVGVVFVGSHTRKTTQQLRALLTSDVIPLAFDSDLVLHEEAFHKEIDRVVREMNQHLKEKRSVAIYTKRKEIRVPGESREVALQRAVQISAAVSSIATRIEQRPDFIIAKGGITSSDVGTKGLHVRRALVLGQICPGIPVWRLGEESRFPGLPYVIFPGNVGEENTLLVAYEILTGDRENET